jgi:hypothetical protein
MLNAQYSRGSNRVHFVTGLAVLAALYTATLIVIKTLIAL